MDNKQQCYGALMMKEKRTQERRHNFHSGTQFPFQDFSGSLIAFDRRRLPDRRLNNIWLELVSLNPGEIQDGWGQIMRRETK
jgi:hypothetical protein